MTKSQKIVRNDSIDISKELESIRKNNIKRMFENEIDYFALEKNIHIFSNSNQFLDLEERKNQLDDLLKILDNHNHSHDDDTKIISHSIQPQCDEKDDQTQSNSSDDKKESKKISDHEVINDYTEIVPTETETEVCHEIENNLKEHHKSNMENDSDKRIIKPQSNPLLIFKVSAKMKLCEIQDIAHKLDIIIEKDSKSKSGKKIPKTKSELLDEINEAIEKNKK